MVAVTLLLAGVAALVEKINICWRRLPRVYIIGVNHPAIVREIPHFSLFPAFPHFLENVPHFWLYFEKPKNPENQDNSWRQKKLLCVILVSH